MLRWETDSGLPGPVKGQESAEELPRTLGRQFRSTCDSDPDGQLWGEGWQKCTKVKNTHFRLPQARDLCFRSSFVRLRSPPQSCYSACSMRDLRGPVTVALTCRGRGAAGRRFPSSVEMVSARCDRRAGMAGSIRLEWAASAHRASLSPTSPSESQPSAARCDPGLLSRPHVRVPWVPTSLSALSRELWCWHPGNASGEVS